MTLGFTESFGRSFVPVWANDSDRSAADTYNANFGPHCVHGDILDVLKHRSDDIPRADIVIGGPPCQGFSLLNKQRDGDHRKHLWMPFLDVVARSEASMFLMENVPQLLGSREHKLITESAESLGFVVTAGKLCAADYGVPQARWRAFILGCRFTDPSILFPPKRTHFDPGRGGSPTPRDGPDSYSDDPTPWRTVRHAISDLPDPVGTKIRDEEPPFDLHFGRSPTEKSIERYKAIPDEGMNRFDLQRRALELTPDCWIRKNSGGTDLFGRLWWDRPAFTIRTEFFKPEKGRYLHPFENRPITHREAARFQAFPDDFRFCGTKIEIAKQIANAVPPLLAAHLAKCAVSMLDQLREVLDPAIGPVSTIQAAV